jgi:hypothetical protein
MTWVLTVGHSGPNPNLTHAYWVALASEREIRPQSPNNEADFERSPSNRGWI